MNGRYRPGHQKGRGTSITEQLVQRGQQQQHIRLLGRITHQADPPYDAFQLAKTAHDLDVVIVQEGAAHGQIVDTVKYLSSIAVVWKGKVGFLKSIDLDTGEAFQVTPAFEMQKLPFDPAANQSIAVSAEGDDGDAFFDLHRESVDPRGVIANGELSVDALRNIRKKVARSVFIMKYQTVNGYELDQSLGMPEMKDCPVTRPG